MAGVAASFRVARLVSRTASVAFEANRPRGLDGQIAEETSEAGRTPAEASSNFAEASSSFAGGPPRTQGFAAKRDTSADARPPASPCNLCDNDILQLVHLEACSASLSGDAPGDGDLSPGIGMVARGLRAPPSTSADASSSEPGCSSTFAPTDLRLAFTGASDAIRSVGCAFNCAGLGSAGRSLGDPGDCDGWRLFTDGDWAQARARGCWLHSSMNEVGRFSSPRFSTWRVRICGDMTAPATWCVPGGAVTMIEAGVPDGTDAEAE